MQGRVRGHTLLIQARSCPSCEHPLPLKQMSFFQEKLLCICMIPDTCKMPSVTRAACFVHGSEEIAKPEYKCKLIPATAWGNAAATPQYKGMMLRPPGRTRSALPRS